MAEPSAQHPLPTRRRDPSPYALVAAGVVLLAWLAWRGKSAEAETQLAGAVLHAEPPAAASPDPPTGLPTLASAAPPVASASGSAPIGEPGIRHEGYSIFPAGVMYAPYSFRRDGGHYDVLIHFHGDRQVVRESAELAGLNALVVVVNLGEGAVRYQEQYRYRRRWPELLEHIQAAAGRRGLREPKLRRVAVSAWSAGYGAIKSILRAGPVAHAPDAILLLDGMHCDWREGVPGWVDEAQMRPFLQAARDAAAGKLLFSITHSSYDPGGYVSTGDAARFLLASVAAEHGAGAVERPMLPPPILARVPSADALVPRRQQKALVALDDNRLGGLRVQSYDGYGWALHRAHLLQMGATVLPELVARWAGEPPHR